MDEGSATAALASAAEVPEGQHVRLDTRQESIVAVLCFVAGLLPVLSRYIPGDVTKTVYSVLVAAVYLAIALVARQRSSLHRYWEIPLAFFALAFFILLDSTVPQFVGTQLLHDTPVSGNPLASTVRGSIVIQLIETLNTLVAVLVVVWASGGSLRSIYFRRGRFGRAYVIGIVGFVAFYVLIAKGPIKHAVASAWRLPT